MSFKRITLFTTIIFTDLVLYEPLMAAHLLMICLYTGVSVVASQAQSEHECLRNVISTLRGSVNNQSQLLDRLVLIEQQMYTINNGYNKELRCNDGNTCTASVNNYRLCDGGGPGVCDVMQGRLEVYHNGQWGSVCDDWFSDISATVTCKMFGYRSGLQRCCANFSEAHSNSPIWFEELVCSGTENSLDECRHSPFGSHNCYHYEDVGVVCA